MGFSFFRQKNKNGQGQKNLCPIFLFLALAEVGLRYGYIVVIVIVVAACKAISQRGGKQQREYYLHAAYVLIAREAQQQYQYREYNG